MTTAIKFTQARTKRSTEDITYKSVYYVDCTDCSYKELAITFDQAFVLKQVHDQLDHTKIETVEVIPLSLKDVFSSDQRFSREKYLLYREKTNEQQPLAPTRRCTCEECQICWNSVASITTIEDDVFEMVSLTVNCLDCFVICNDRKQGW